ncbi:hypothetical protein BH23GEM5_BH23GEM5_30300 [soil metagenome]
MQARKAFREEVEKICVEDLVFVDESGISTAMTRLYGRSPAGERAYGSVPAGHWTQVTMLGGLSLQGMIACMSIQSATDTPVFAAFTREVLVPALRPGQVVILDNLSPHKADEVRALIEGAGCRLLLLPPYSPDLNPTLAGLEQAEDAPSLCGSAYKSSAGACADSRDRPDCGRRCPGLARPLWLCVTSKLSGSPL